ncbi:NB-ARC domain-containing protein [Sphaerospermopsis sp. FACHB-1194]|uniref:NB-ARC domain-containing protein n=1 Tax=Sphaerospermopsis sp. FACHB-1194 TaxID=2692862 RepID=UPI0016819997|nr:NB-ARC domain-containing protein [Sphaerospermopsis sp. FACHB-1194]MBD2147600.1 ATP-binding protein [Sphaerospermopsis sp. FACHB-1194]
MTVTEVLQIVDNLVFKHTGNHLTDLQISAIKGIWDGKLYSEIADEFDYGENYIGNISRDLYKILSKELGEEVTKTNFCWSIERIANSFNPQLVGIGIKNNINWCPNNKDTQKIEVNKEDKSQQKTTYTNLNQSPKITHFYGRNNELSTLSAWIENPSTRLISILGISGIGKTTLIKHFIDTHPLHFDAIIWKNLKLSNSLNSILTEIITEINVNIQNINTNKLLKQTLELFNQKRCLIILDNLEEIFTPQQYAGKYQPEHQNYQTFLQMITAIEHQSCVILISQEKCQELISLDDELYPIHSLELSGLGNAATEILKNQRLQNQEHWLNLINLYETHPRYLQYISILIKDVFQGEIAEFIQENNLILTEDIKSNILLTWERLTNIEKQTLLKISQNDQPLSREEIKKLLSLSSLEIINSIQSLTRRFLLSKSENDERLFHLTPVLREYLKNVC